ncbi:MAG: preprotein translocase subunit SecE [Clostridia bacterium]|jgi:preprotein translocase subunit SecE|nr:preprotein translocase subunit SecE [Clostridia bacterium]
MADENKKAVAKADTSETAKSPKKDKKPSKFSPKNIGKGIARFFKDLRGETKKIVWPGRKMVIKSTGIVLAAILVIGAGIWAIDFAVSGAVTAMNKAANETTTAAAEVVEDTTEEAVEDTTEASEEETTEATTAA